MGHLCHGYVSHNQRVYIYIYLPYDHSLSPLITIINHHYTSVIPHYIRTMTFFSALDHRCRTSQQRHARSTDVWWLLSIDELWIAMVAGDLWCL